MYSIRKQLPADKIDDVTIGDVTIGASASARVCASDRERAHFLRCIRVPYTMINDLCKLAANIA